MRVTRSGNILRRGSVLHSKDALSDKLSSIRTDDVDSEDFISVLVSEDLDKSIIVFVTFGSGVGQEGEVSFVVSDALSLELLFGLTYIGDFWVSVDYIRNSVVVDMSREAADQFDYSDSFLFSLMGEHRTFDDVSDSVDSFSPSHPMFVDRDSAVFV